MSSTFKMNDFQYTIRIQILINSKQIAYVVRRTCFSTYYPNLNKNLTICVQTSQHNFRLSCLGFSFRTTRTLQFICEKN